MDWRLHKIKQRLSLLKKGGGQNKDEAEIQFWKEELQRYVSWYQAKEKLHGCPPPKHDEKTIKYGMPIDAAITWLKVFQEKKYLQDLKLNAKTFSGLRILDIGCGPFPNLLAFSNCERHNLDPLIDLYKEAGYPIKVFSEMGCFYHCAPAEKMPFPDKYFDVVISVNAIDHVNDFAQTAKEIKRVMKQDGIFRMHVHYHKKTITEPIELNDKKFLKHYEWIPGLHKIWVGNKKDCGSHTALPDELFVLWGNSTT